MTISSLTVTDVAPPEPDARPVGVRSAPGLAARAARRRPAPEQLVAATQSLLSKEYQP